MSSGVDPLKFLIVENNDGDYVLISDSIEEKSPFAKIDLTKTYKSDVETIPNPYDIILLDLSLDDVCGENLVKDIKKKKGEIITVETSVNTIN